MRATRSNWTKLASNQAGRHSLLAATGATEVAPGRPDARRSPVTWQAWASPIILIEPTRAQLTKGHAP